MSAYVKHFNKHYADGFKDRPDKTTPVTADILNNYETTFESVEEYLDENQIPTALSDLTQDNDHQTVTGAEKAAWNGKADPSTIPQFENKETLDEFSESAAGGLLWKGQPIEGGGGGGSVSTVNGVGPDEDGNVRVPAEAIPLLYQTQQPTVYQAISITNEKVAELEEYKLAMDVSANEITLRGGTAGGGGGMHEYSTEEKIVGKWIDGSYVFERVFMGTATNGSTSNWIDTGFVIDSFKEKIYENGSIVINGNHHDIASLQIKVENKKLYVWQRLNTGSTTYQYKIILGYTKTTDTTPTALSLEEEEDETES